jgi:cytochrome c oxidase subunit 4
MFFEDPALLVGIPLLVLGIIGLGIAALTLMAPQPQPAGAPAVVHGAHPDPMEYVQIGLTLAIITAIEVAIYYVDIPRKPFIGALMALSAAKFSLVVLFFMHLKFDSRLFTTAFATGFALVIAVFTVVLTTLGGNIV